MNIEVQLGKADRARLGVGEWLAMDLLSVTVREAMILQQGADLGDGLTVQYESPADWRADLVRRVGDRPSPVWTAELVLVWLALRRAGVQLPLAGLVYDVEACGYRRTDEPPAAEPSGDVESGKGGDGDPSIPDSTSASGSGDISQP
jgi:hypothetical protein